MRGVRPAHKITADTRRHHHTPRTEAHPNGLMELWKQIHHPGCVHPVGQVSGIPASDQKHIGVADLWHPQIRWQTWKSGQLKHTDRLPPKLCHRGAGLIPTDEIPDLRARTDPRMTVHRGGNAERIRFVNGFAKQVKQRCLDAVILDSSGCKQEFHRTLALDGACRDALGEVALQQEVDNKRRDHCDYKPSEHQAEVALVLRLHRDTGKSQR